IGFGPSLDTNGSGIVSLLGVVWHSPTKLASYIQARRRQNTMIESLRNLDPVMRRFIERRE
ncbi:MAG: hypothetical protein Q8R13_00710, partial [bacterium]|nr:hypothetical protein [bacterium]